MLFINIDSYEAYTEYEVQQAYDEEVARLAATGGTAQASTYEQWLEEQFDRGLLAVDIDEFLDDFWSNEM
jgi:hypothetical protein